LYVIDIAKHVSILLSNVKNKGARYFSFFKKNIEA
jgi:hypothetical protein